ncbi:MAG TPA: single-stranded-DNA-specific exonuclease RecJ [Puia sp.]|nr:single-stranded-DNA-specific exonuclease RecJ [Puia sp.]
MEKRWKIKNVDEDRVNELAEVLKIHPLISRVLVGRGIESFKEAKDYFRPDISQLHDPWLMKDMELAVKRILLAFDRKEKILIFGDYDVDGTSSVALMYQFLCRTHEPSSIDFYIPHRQREGYGVSKAGIDFADRNTFSLIISVDCGVKSVDLVGYAKSKGIDFIICDHHLPDIILPPAVAILNPKQSGCDYPYKELCGCGVAFKLITALSHSLSLTAENYLIYLDLVAIAIAADIVPMTGENRTLCFLGLKKINEHPNHGIRALMTLSGLSIPASITSLVFTIAPRVNAAGRMDDARKAVLMFIAAEYGEALLYANLLHADNSDRRETDSSITEEALALIDGDELMRNRRSTVLYQAHWHKGVVGIVASRLIEKYYRPTIVLTQSGEFASGSARSVPGFNLYEALHACREWLLGYGGHFAAAGMTLAPENVAQFSKKFEEVVSETIEPRFLIPELVADAVADFRDLDMQNYRIIGQMEPFGPENNKPVFISRQVYETGYAKLLKEKHLRVFLRQGDQIFSGIAFNMGDKWDLVNSGQPLDIAYTLDINEWNGEKKLQLKILDIKRNA